MEQRELNYLILAFVFLIVGSVLVGVIAKNTNQRIDKAVVSDETFNLASSCMGFNISGTGLWEINESNPACNVTVSNYPTGWKVQDCPVSSVVVANTTDLTYPALVEGTDYKLFPSTGLIQMLNTSSTDNGDFNTTYVDYKYCANDYLNSSWGRSILTTVPGFFALALLGLSLWLFFSVFRSLGIIKK